MKKVAIVSAVIIAASASLFAAPKKNQLGQQNQNMNMGQMADCTQLTPDEQNFANQLSDMNNRSMFCSQFSPQQRQQAMQIMGQPDATGSTITPDQSVQQVMQMGGTAPMNQQRGRSTGGCPVK